MILDHLLPKCYLGGQAFHFRMWTGHHLSPGGLCWGWYKTSSVLRCLHTNEAVHQLKYNCDHHISYIQCSVLFSNSTNTLSKSNEMYLAVQPANGNRTNVLFARLKYAVSSLSTSLYSILLILLLSQVLCIAPYTYAEKFYQGFYYFLWDCHCYQRGYVTCSLHRKQVVKQRFKHRSIQRRSLNTWSLASIV